MMCKVPAMNFYIMIDNLFSWDNLSDRKNLQNTVLQSRLLNQLIPLVSLALALCSIDLQHTFSILFLVFILMCLYVDAYVCIFRMHTSFIHT